MNVLALELSSARGSIALQNAGEIVFEREFPNDRKHSGVFFENLQLCLAGCGNPDAIVVGLGPGSYAGTRIAIAAAVGLSAATGAKLCGVSSLCAMPVDANEYAAIGDARRQTFYFAQVRDRELVEPPQLCAPSELHERLSRLAVPVLATETIAAFPQAVVCYPSASLLATIAPSPERPAGSLEPMYLREPHITYPKTALPHAR